MTEPVWDSSNRKKRKQARNELHRLRSMATAKFEVVYDLTFDGGGDKFSEYYPSLFKARLAAFWWLKFRSWGGTAKAYSYPRPKPIPEEPKKRKRFFR